MRKCIGFMLFFFFLAVALLPNTYSVWHNDLGISGSVQIKAHKLKGENSQVKPEFIEENTPENTETIESKDIVPYYFTPENERDDEAGEEKSVENV